MSYIQKGDKILVYGKPAIATSNEYTKLVYDSYDYDLESWGYEGGTATGYINVEYENGVVASVPTRICSKA
jgi:hypothetical protein